MNIGMRNLSDIQPYGNPRINDHAVETVAALIRAFGLRQPIVVDKRASSSWATPATKQPSSSGLTQVPVHVGTGLTPAHVQACRIADNKTGEPADWDHDQLTQELALLQGLDFDLDLIGFSPVELNQLLDSVNVTPRLVDPDEIPEPSQDATSQRGDMWRLGDHRVPKHDPLTEKPVELAVRTLHYSSRQGENVLDLFSGCGSTLIAADQTRRRALLMEFDPFYVDVLVHPWQNFTGRRAEREVREGKRLVLALLSEAAQGLGSVAFPA